MDEKLRQIQRLYGEDVPSNGIQPASSPELDRELEELRQVKDAMDRRIRRSPSPRAVQAVLDAARTATLPGGTVDRPPARRVLRRALRPSLMGAAVVVLAVASLFVLDQQNPIAIDSTKTPISERADAVPMQAQELTANAESDAPNPELSRSSQPLPEQDQVASPGAGVARAGSARAAEQVEASSVELSWDGFADMQALYDRVEHLSEISPAGSQWQATPARRVLSAPVGLARTQHASMEIPQ